MSRDEDFDGLFTEIAARAGGIEPLLDQFFGFLNRKTDFYVEFEPTKGRRYKMGFPKGEAEKIVVKSFRKHNLKSYNDMAGAEEQSEEPVPPSPPKKDLAATSTAYTTPKKSKPTSVPPTPASPLMTPEGKQVPTGNGGVSLNYSWTQTLKDVSVYVDVDANCKSKDVKCTIKAKSLSLSILGKQLIEGHLEDPVKSEESMWTMNSDSTTEQKQIVITLDKTRQTWWKHVIVGHEEIDTTKVDSSQNIGEYDESTQAAIRKIMFDQRQKMLGNPTSEELELEKLLEKAAKVPGSPI